MTDTLTNTLTLNSIRARIRERAQMDAKGATFKLSSSPRFLLSQWDSAAPRDVANDDLWEAAWLACDMATNETGGIRFRNCAASQRAVCMLEYFIAYMKVMQEHADDLRTAELDGAGHSV
jgi:hypothetical protein